MGNIQQLSCLKLKITRLKNPTVNVNNFFIDVASASILSNGAIKKDGGKYSVSISYSSTLKRVTLHVNVLSQVGHFAHIAYF